MNQTVRYKRNRRILGMREEQFRKLTKFMMLPLVILILIVVILITDHGKGGTRKGAEGNRATEAETGVSIEVASEDEKEESGQAETGQAETEQETRAPYDHANAVPERSTNEALVGLAKDYLDAYVRGDADAMYRIFGRTDQTGLEGLRQRMSAERKLYEAFENTCVYAVPGVSDDDWILYISTQGWFRKIETPAPILIRSFVVKNADGSYRMKEDSALTEAEAAAVKATDASAAVQKLSAAQRTELAKAIVSDAKLGSLYERLRVGGTEPETRPETEAADVQVTDAVVEVNGEAGTAGTAEQHETATEGEAVPETGQAPTGGEKAPDTTPEQH